MMRAILGTESPPRALKRMKTSTAPKVIARRRRDVFVAARDEDHLRERDALRGLEDGGSRRPAS